jgi:hypothetical protein
VGADQRGRVDRARHPLAGAVLHSGGTVPVQAWGYWNLVIGFGLMVGSLAILSRWR